MDNAQHDIDIDIDIDVRSNRDERLPWHAPEISRLVVALDTKYNRGSNTDAHSGSTEG